MSWRAIGTYYVLALVMGIYLFARFGFVGPEEPRPETTAVPLVAANAGAADRLLVTRDRLELEAEREGERWSLAKPVGLEITSDLVEAFLDTLTTIPPIEILPATPTSGNEYGLLPALTTIEISSGDELLARVKLGKRNPTRTAVYASKEGEEVVYLLGLNAQYYVELIFEDITRQLGGFRGASSRS